VYLSDLTYQDVSIRAKEVDQIGLSATLRSSDPLSQPWSELRGRWPPFGPGVTWTR
jgi:hypothetical protein